VAEHLGGGAGSPSLSASRIAVEDTAPWLLSRSGAIVTSKPMSRPKSRSISAVPVRPLPKQKSAPTTTWLTPRPSARTSRAKASADRPESLASNGSSASISTPSFSSRLARASAFIRRKGGASGAKYSRGCGSNVTTPSGASARRARPITWAWPRWTPSKFPMATEAPRSSGLVNWWSRTVRMART
jgi:hypothetical protein